MRYAIYYRLSDGRNETEVVDNSKDRDIRVKYLKMFNDFTDACFCKIYASGEYGKMNLIKGSMANCL